MAAVSELRILYRVSLHSTKLFHLRYEYSDGEKSHSGPIAMQTLNFGKAMERAFFKG
jgi:hypothetical protein